MSENKKISTVNIVELIDASNANVAVHSFVDDDEGNRQAEQKMFELAKKNGYKGDAKNSDEFMDDEGETWCKNGPDAIDGYMVLITHS